MDQHDLVCKLKDIALELGKTPTKHEAISHGIREYQLLKNFGTYAALLQAAGLQPNSKKITQAIFEKDIEKHLEDYEPRQVIERPKYPKIASISDIHWPFSSPRVVDAFIRFVDKEKPEYVFLNGDAWDMYSHSRFPRSHNVFTPRDEQNQARKMNEEFWDLVKKAAPGAKYFQMMGNHDVRPMKKALQEYPEAEDWIKEKLTQLFKYEGVTTIMDPREEMMLGDIAIFHGYRSKLGDHRDYTLYNCINGHTHVGGVVYRRIRGQTLWELNSGLAGDPEAKGLTYTPQKITNWTPGFGWVDEWGPRFIPC